MDTIEAMSQRIAADPSDVEAYLKQAQAYFKLEEFGSADKAITAGLGQCAGDDHAALRKKLELWQRKCATHLSGSTTVSTPAAAAAPAAEQQPPPPAPKPKPAIRQDWFQSHGAITVSLFVRNRTKEDVAVHVEEQSLKVEVRMADGKVERWAAERLHAPIVVGSAKTEVKSMKIEIQMTKQAPGNWDALEAAAQPGPLKASEPAAAAAANPAASRPVYPTSSKKAKDWSTWKNDEEDEKLEGDAALNKLFQDIYSRGDEQTRQAMAKSFTESAGTVLSTNWAEVGAKKVEGSAPKGMEMKKWTDHTTQEHT